MDHEPTPEAADAPRPARAAVATTPAAVVAEYYTLKGVAGVLVRSLVARVDGDVAVPVTEGRQPLNRGVGVPGCWSTPAEALAWRAPATPPA